MVNYDAVKKAAKDIQKHIDVPLWILNKSGDVIYSGREFFQGKEGFFDVKREYMYEREIYEYNNMTFCNIFYDDSLYFIICLEGTGSYVKKIMALISMIFEQIEGQYTKEQFFYDLIYGELDKDRILHYVEKYKIDRKTKYIVAIVESTHTIDDAIKIVNNIFDKNNLYIIKVNDTRFAFLLPYNDSPDLFNEYKTVKDMIESEVYIKVNIAVSRKPVGIEDASIAYKEAEAALIIGKKLDRENGIYFYDSFVFPELISGISYDKAKKFVEKMLVDFDIFNDDELMQTLNVFFKNSLNLSETSRELYIHRNTLVYRLDKIYRMTGLDPKQFDDAVLLKTIMVLVKLYNISR